MKKSISIIWTTEDVLNVRPDLTEEQSSEVLGELEHNHDATVGINWGVIECTADNLFPPVK